MLAAPVTDGDGVHQGPGGIREPATRFAASRGAATPGSDGVRPSSVSSSSG